MNITIFGCGYVGLVTGACLADAGHHVLCVDIDEKKVSLLKQGELPIYEPGLKPIVSRATKAGHLEFTTDTERAIHFAKIQIIAVGTPPNEDGSADLSHVLTVARMIAADMDQEKIIVSKSTVPVGTGDQVKEAVSNILIKRAVQIEFHIVSNPEFLKEGGAVADFMKPDRIIIGADSDYAAQHVREMYTPFSRNHEKIIQMDTRSAELTKYAANAMLATKISFMNEMASLAEHLGADIEKVRIGIGSDPRIGYQFIYPGCGFGGSCFPKDISALEKMSRDAGFDAVILNAIQARNSAQKQILFEKINKHFEGNLKGKVLAVWGLAFKPDTDDIREAPSRVLMEQLWNKGATVQAYDPAAMDKARRIYGDRDDFKLYESPDDALNNADALVIVTEWRIFRSPDFNTLKTRLKSPVIFDGRNLFDPKAMLREGIIYYGIGRS